MKKEKNFKLYAILTVLAVGVLICGFFILKNIENQRMSTNDSLTGEKSVPTLMKVSSYYYNGEFWKYEDAIKIITFEDKIDIPSDAVEYWDVSENKNGSVMAYIKINASNTDFYDLYIQGDGRIYANPDSSYLFLNFEYVDKINNIEKLDTSKVVDMSMMFYRTGYSSPVFTLDLGDNFDTSKVTEMGNMFAGTGYSSPVFTLDLGDKFDTSKVTEMGNMFAGTGHSNTSFTLDLGDKFDTSNVTNMHGMFDGTGYSSQIFTLDLGDKFDTSNVTEMYEMFYQTGYSSPVFTLNLGDNFNTSNVTDMTGMFYQTGYSSMAFTLNLGIKFNTSNVLFMDYMFSQTGYSSSAFKLDCSSWNVDKVTEYSNFNYGVTSKVNPPNWVN